MSTEKRGRGYLYSNFTHHRQNLEATKMSFRRRDKQSAVHPDDGILLSAEKKHAIKPRKDMEGI